MNGQQGKRRTMHQLQLPTGCKDQEHWTENEKSPAAEYYLMEQDHWAMQAGSPAAGWAVGQTTMVDDREKDPEKNLKH